VTNSIVESVDVNGENSSDFRVIDNFRCRENLKNPIEGKFNTHLGSKDRSVVAQEKNPRRLLCCCRNFRYIYFSELFKRENIV
jgi:hypothetical protein